MTAARWQTIATLLVCLSACSLEPGFDTANGSVTYYCGAEGRGSIFRVTYTGKEATIDYLGMRHVLHFVSSVWPRHDDRYEGEGYLLTLDPEVFLTTRDGVRIGPCG
jgi:hypothetical protein